MKIRTALVSNSSSSSFIIIGCQFDEELEKQLKLTYPVNKDEDEYDWGKRVENKIGLSILYVEPGYVIGKVLADFDSSECLKTQKYSYEELGDMIKNVANKLNRDNIKLMMGTRPA